MNPCTACQEELAHGGPLSEARALHVAHCADCSAVAAAYSLVDDALESLCHDVPDGFADRVMSRLDETKVEHVGSLFDRRWVRFALTPAALLCAAVNVVEFLASVVSHSVGLGGTP